MVGIAHHGQLLLVKLPAPKWEPLEDGVVVTPYGDLGPAEPETPTADMEVDFMVIVDARVAEIADTHLSIPALRPWTACGAGRDRPEPGRASSSERD